MQIHVRETRTCRILGTRHFNDTRQCDFNSPARVKLNRVTFNRDDFRAVIMQIRGVSLF